MSNNNWKNDLRNCDTVAALKTLYRSLARAFHPDLGGDGRIMQQINDLYHEILESFDGQVSNDERGKPHTYRYNYHVEQEIVDKIRELFAAKLSAEVEIWLIGTWIWILNTDRKLDYEKLMAAKCRWHSKRHCWYWRNADTRSFYSNASLGSLAHAYGCQKFSEEEKKKKRRPVGVIA